MIEELLCRGNIKLVQCKCERHRGYSRYIRGLSITSLVRVARTAYLASLSELVNDPRLKIRRLNEYSNLAFRGSSTDEAVNLKYCIVESTDYIIHDARNSACTRIPMMN